MTPLKPSLKQQVSLIPFSIEKVDNTGTMKIFIHHIIFDYYSSRRFGDLLLSVSVL